MMGLQGKHRYRRKLNCGGRRNVLEEGVSRGHIQMLLTQQSSSLSDTDYCLKITGRRVSHLLKPTIITDPEHHLYKDFTLKCRVLVVRD